MFVSFVSLQRKKFSTGKSGIKYFFVLLSDLYLIKKENRHDYTAIDKPAIYRRCWRFE